MSNPTIPTLQHQLLSNRLPLPQNYNGIEWSTKLTYSRKSIPSYLQQDLPPLKYHYIRQQFKTINKIECPRLTYFKDKIVGIKDKRQGHHRSCSERHGIDGYGKHKYHMCKGDQLGLPKTKGRNNSDTKINSLISQLTHLREQLTYTLITTERNSNVITKLIDKGNMLEQQLQFRRKRLGGNASGRQKKYLQKLWKGKEEQRCFADTMQLVIKARKDGMMQNNEQIEQDKNQQSQVNTNIANLQSNNPADLRKISSQIIDNSNKSKPTINSIESAMVFDTSPDLQKKQSRKMLKELKKNNKKLWQQGIQ